MHDKKALLLAFALPPASNSGTHRPLSLIKHAKEAGWHIEAISDPLSQGNPPEAGLFLQQQLPKDASITRHKNMLEHTSWRLTPQIDGGFSNVVAMVLHAIKTHWNKRPKVIIASGPPFYLWIAGMYLAKFFNAKLVLDYRDEWTLCPFAFVSKTYWDKWFETRCVKFADKIIYTTLPHKQAHQKAFDLPEAKLGLIANGWDESIKTLHEQPCGFLDKTKLNISYIGKLSKHADPSSFLRLIEKTLSAHPSLTTKLSINFVGTKHPEMVKILESFSSRMPVINLIDEVRKVDAIAIMENSDYLLMLCEERLSSYIPGKLYDYLSTFRPILAYGHEGEVSRIIRSLSAGRFIGEGDLECLQELLLSEPPELSEAPIEKWLSGHTRKKLAFEFFGLI